MPRAAAGVPMHRRGCLGEEALYWHSSWRFQIPGISSEGTFALERRVMSEFGETFRNCGLPTCSQGLSLLRRPSGASSPGEPFSLALLCRVLSPCVCVSFLGFAVLGLSGV